MAVKPYQEGAVWSFRLRRKGQDVYRTGYSTQAEARREADKLCQKILDVGKPKHDGPWRHTLAEALQLYAIERLPFLKGARQEANRINRYLRAAGLATVRVNKISVEATETKFHEVTLDPARSPRKIPNGLHAHRAELTERTAGTERLVRQLAKTRMAEITAYEIQELIDVMVLDGYQAASVGLERALLRQLFNYARKVWLWVEPARNPATHLSLPKIDNARDRVLTNAEWDKISLELEKSRNPYVAPAIALLIETAMRASEPLLHATWADVDWGQNLLRLTAGKTGARDVPLNPAAVNILMTLAALRPDDDFDPRVLPISYEALKAAWNRACHAAGVEGVRIHDLRHTAATRFTLELNGNLPVLKVITGHKTISQLMRYINVKPDDVSRLLHDRPLTEDNAPAGMHLTRAELVPPSLDPVWKEAELPSNVIPLRRVEGTRTS